MEAIMNNQIIELFLSGYKYGSKDSSDFNFRFNSRYSIKYFYEEFNKFASFIDSFFYAEDHIVTSINSYEFVLPDKYISHFFKLYNYSTKCSECVFHSSLICDFLLTYYNSLTYNKSKGKKYVNAQLRFNKIASHYNQRKFYNNFMDELFKFYNDSINFAITQSLYISPETVQKVLHNLKKEQHINLIVSSLIKDDRYYQYIYKFDSQISVHKNYYIDFIIKLIDQPFSTRNYSDLFDYLLNKNLLSDYELKKITNLFVKKTNKLVSKYFAKKESFINAISEVESLKNEISSISSLSNLSGLYKKKLRECITCVLNFKRYLISDEDYMNNDMHEFKTDTIISNTKITKFKKELNKNILRIYSASTVDFDKCMIDSINYYSKYALQSMFSSYSIDAKSKTYKTNKDFINDISTSFEIYYDNLGLEYTKKNNEKLLNKKGSGFYSEMLKELSRMFMIHQNILLSFMDEYNFDSIRTKIDDGMGNILNNDYVRIVYCILYVELAINIILKKHNLDWNSSYKENISKLFEIYKDDPIKRNGLMYIYYSFYEHTGPNIRNKIMHGMFFKENLKVPLIVSFSATIIIGWIMPND